MASQPLARATQRKQNFLDQYEALVGALLNFANHHKKGVACTLMLCQASNGTLIPSFIRTQHVTRYPAKVTLRTADNGEQLAYNRSFRDYK
jgi:hypothetical protein